MQKDFLQRFDTLMVECRCERYLLVKWIETMHEKSYGNIEKASKASFQSNKDKKNF